MTTGKQRSHSQRVPAGPGSWELLNHSQPPDQSAINAFWTPNKVRLAWVGIILVFIGFRWTLIPIPLERDEGEYAYIAQQALQGDVPYRDAFDQKPPGVFLIYAIGMFIFGRSAEAIHSFQSAWTLATVWLLYRLVARLFGTAGGLFAAFALARRLGGSRLAAMLAALGVALHPLLVFQVTDIRSEPLFSALATAALVLALASTKNPRTLVVSSLAAGCLQPGPRLPRSG